MARFLVALLAAAVVAVQAGGQLGHAAPATAEVFWRAVLPHSPLPDAVLRLLRPAAADADTSSVSEAEDRPPFDYRDYSRSSSNDEPSKRTAVARDFSYDSYSDAGKRHGAAARARDFGYDNYSGAGKRRGAAAGARDFGYDNYSGAGKRHGAAAGARDFDYDDYSGSGKRRGAAADTPFSNGFKATGKTQAEERRGAATENLEPYGYDYKTPSSSHAGSGAAMAMGGKAKTTTVFFHEEAVRVGQRLSFRFPPAAPAALGFLPRHVADSIPFTTAALPGVMATFGVDSDSATVAGMEATLGACESPTMAGESKFCATSLEALVERAMGVLGTRDIRPVTSTLPRAGAPLQTYTVRAVRPVEGGPVFVACHDEAYPYTVYRCHATGPSRAYMVEMEGARGGDAVSIATMCHTDTSLWDPEHVSFKLLGTKPGGTPVCHLMPYGHIIWAKNVKRSPA